jgi:hypothetical protein
VQGARDNLNFQLTKPFLCPGRNIFILGTKTSKPAEPKVKESKAKFPIRLLVKIVREVIPIISLDAHICECLL